MSRRKISASLAAEVRQQARHRCGYCLVSEALIGMQLEFEHLLPLAAGGTTKPENLWLSCRNCNSYKHTQTTAPDPEGGQVVALFNPRTQRWAEHFGWSQNGLEINGLTPVGRATVNALKLNHPLIVVARRLWVSMGWWPPLD